MNSITIWLTLKLRKEWVHTVIDIIEFDAVLTCFKLNCGSSRFVSLVFTIVFRFQEHHEKEEEDEHTPDQIKLMQTQDLKYINMKRTIETNKIQRLQSQLHLIDTADKVPNSHTFFVDDEKVTKNFDLAKRLDTHPSLLQHRTNRLRIADLEKLKLPEIDKKVTFFCWFIFVKLVNYLSKTLLSFVLFNVKKAHQMFGHLEHVLGTIRMIFFITFCFYSAKFVNFVSLLGNKTF